MLCPFSVLVPTSALGEAPKYGIAVEDRKIAESLRLHRVKNQATRKRKICRFETTRLAQSESERNASISEFFSTALTLEFLRLFLTPLRVLAGEVLSHS
ncbi:hypothetical protein PIB30_043673 [Stylosanthes scabra]|uniref:Secreted protein n=1 Tax=Stylosanthes scabra TaxID=79078 RepID=A0ABU6QG32_9FABA|nr:hypothetical protein [Stylosanthes scabra]